MNTIVRLLLWSALLLPPIVLAPPAAFGQGGPCVPLTANLDVTSSITICPGAYQLDDPEGDGVIRVKASHVVIDMTGVTLVSSLKTGWGVYCNGFDDVTVRGATISGFRSAVFFENGMQHRVENCRLWLNRRRPVTHTAADFLAVWPDWTGQLSLDQIGNGVVFKNVQAATVRNVHATQQQNGIGLFECTGINVLDCNCSHNEGWGIHLHRSSHCSIIGNRADDNYNKQSTYCSLYQGNGCDTAALLVIKDSNDNFVKDNSLRRSGDGVFSAAQEGLTHWGADRNVYVNNDCSYAWHIGIESTFSLLNEFYGNNGSDCGRYGFWLGFSRRATLTSNRIHDNAWAGIAIESGQGIDVHRNSIVGNGAGVQLWRGPTSLLDQDSKVYRFTRNHVIGNTGLGFSVVDTHAVTIRENLIQDNAGGNLRFSVDDEAELSGPLAVNRNNILGLGTAAFNVDNSQGTTVDLTSNWWGTTNLATIEATLKGISQLAIYPPHALPRLEIQFMLGSDGPFILNRVVNERADDAADSLGPGIAPTGNARDELVLGAAGPNPGDPLLLAGLRFKDVYLPGSATILQARLYLPPAATTFNSILVDIRGEAADDPAAFEAGALPATRSPTAAAVSWPIYLPWSAGSAAMSPDVGSIVSQIIARPGWESGNAMAFLLEGKTGSASGRAVLAFDGQGYADLPNTPYEFRRFRKHRSTKLRVEYTSSDGLMALERELALGTDDADTCLNCNEVYLGYSGGPLSGGFRFDDVLLPAGAAVTAASLLIATDGTYTQPLYLVIRGETQLAPPTYSAGSLPYQRPKTVAAVPWYVTQTWVWTEWHATPDITAPLLEILGLPGWTSGSAVAFDIIDSGSTTHRRVWAFDRDPRTTKHDFPNFGATPIVPILTAPLKL